MKCSVTWLDVIAAISGAVVALSILACFAAIIVVTLCNLATVAMAVAEWLLGRAT